MKLSRKYLTALCILLTLLFLLPSCGETAKDVKTETTAVEAESAAMTDTVTEPTEANVPAADYEGYEFRFITNDHAQLTWAYTTMDVDVTDGEPINDAVYNRNRAVEAKYNIIITDIPKGFGAVYTNAQKSIAAGANDYDVIIEDIRNSQALISKGYVLTVDKLSYIDLSMPWWDHNVERDLSIGTKNFFLGGDYTLSHYDTTCVLVFNKNIAEDYGLENPYQLVMDGTWNFDDFESMISVVSDDLDGDSKYTEADLYGFSSLSFVFYPAFMTGANAQSVKLDKANMPQFVLGDEYNIKVFERLNAMMHIGNTSYDVIPRGKDHRLPEYMFAADKVLFWSQLIFWTTQLRDMKSDFGIIPYPKFTEEQENYNVIMFGTPLTMIPATNADLERTGIVLEVLAAESRKEFIPAYYEITMKNKISRDDETSEILDIIFANRSYNLTQTYWSFIDNGVVSLLEKNKNELASYAESVRSKAEDQIAATVDSFIGE